MRIENQATPEGVLLELGARLARLRIEQGITQAEAARRAGVSKRTIERFEDGGDIQLTTLVRLLGVLGMTERIDMLIPESTISPMELLQHQTKKRKRATSKQKKQAKRPWQWGDEQ